MKCSANSESGKKIVRKGEQSRHPNCVSGQNVNEDYSNLDSFKGFLCDDR